MFHSQLRYADLCSPLEHSLTIRYVDISLSSICKLLIHSVQKVQLMFKIDAAAYFTWQLLEGKLLSDPKLGYC